MIQIRPLSSDDLPWVEQLVGAGFGGRWQARLGSLVDALGCPGLVAEREGERVGVLTYQSDESEVEIVYIEARILEVHSGAADDARRTPKPTIPVLGAFGIPVRDEIVLGRSVRVC